MTNTPTELTSAISALADARYVSLATFRRDGRKVATPVWFAELDGAYCVFSAADAGKVKRLRLGDRAEVATCDIKGGNLGTWLAATATLVDDPRLVAQSLASLRRKYGLQMWMADFFAKLSGRFNKRQYITFRLSANEANEANDGRDVESAGAANETGQ